MKSKIAEWGNSHGIRITSAMMDHLNIQAGEEVELSLTSKGIEILRKNETVDYLKSVTTQVLDAVLKSSNPVKIVEDPDTTSDVAYTVIDINPCSPVIREVPIGTKNSYATLADAKAAAREILQVSIAEAKKSQSELRQVGIKNISYIQL